MKAMTGVTKTGRATVLEGTIANRLYRTMAGSRYAKNLDGENDAA